MNISNLIIFLTNDTILTRDGAAAGAASEAGYTAAAGGLFGGGNWSLIIIMYGALFIFAYFFMYRPHKKRQKEVREMLSAIKVGDNIVTTSGMYGKIVEMPSTEIYIVEFGLNKGIKIPVTKSSISDVSEKELNF